MVVSALRQTALDSVKFYEWQDTLDEFEFPDVELDIQEYERREQELAQELGNVEDVKLIRKWGASILNLLRSENVDDGGQCYNYYFPVL